MKEKKMNRRILFGVGIFLILAVVISIVSASYNESATENKVEILDYLLNFSFIQASQADDILDLRLLYFLDQNLAPAEILEIEEINYTGLLYDVKVPNHLILVRRNTSEGTGRPVWSGNSNYDLQFLEIKCGNQTMNYSWVNNSVFIPNYSCNSTGYETSKVLSEGAHHLMFEFGNFTEYAHNWAENLSNWNYRKPIEINSSSSLTNYQIKINVTYDSDMNNSFKDLRFTNEEDNLTLDYWVESKSDGNWALVWIEVDSIDANNGTQVYMYYGNPSASSASDVNSTFIREIDGNQSVKGSWHFDENSGTTAYDTSGNDNDGTLTNGPSWVDGKFGKALEFDGSNNYVDCGNGESLNIIDAITIEAWFNRDTLDTSTWTAILSKEAGNTGYELQFRKGTNDIGFQFYGGGAWRFSPEYTTSPNVWYHAVGTFDGSYLRLYINGKEVTPATSFTGSIVSSTNPVCMGNNPSFTDRRFNGTIDEVRIYNRALSAEEISDLYNNYGYTTTNYPGKVLVRKYTSPEPTPAVGGEESPPPVTSTPIIKPDIAHTADDLTCNATITDNQTATGLTAHWKWYKDGVLNLSGTETGIDNNTNTLITTLGSGNTTKGENWICEVTPNDCGCNGTAKNSTQKTIQNTAPNVKDIYHDNNKSWGENWTFKANVSDIDNDTITIYLQFNRTGNWENITSEVCNNCYDETQLTLYSNWSSGDVGTKYYRFYATDGDSVNTTIPQSVTVIGWLLDTLEQPITQNFNVSEQILIRLNLSDECSNTVTGAGITIEVLDTNNNSFECSGVNDEGDGWYNCTWDSTGRNEGNYSIRINSS
ncbi:MAG: hypothetical protein DRP06_02095, partial [Candidatus Aenigmatarchaeota archaeon]